MALDQVLKVIFTGDSRNLSASLKNVQGELKNFGSAATRTFSGVQTAFAALGVTLTAGAVGAGIKRIVDSMDALNDASKRLGVSTESLSALGYAAEQSGSNLEELQTGLRFLNRSLYEASRGNREMATTLRQFGISALDDTESALRKLADGFARMPDGAQKTAVAMRVLGRSGANLIPLLNEGSAGLEKFRQEAERLGIIVSGEAARGADEFNDSINKAGKAATAFGISIVQSALPALNEMAGALAEAAEKGDGLYGLLTRLGQRTGSALFDELNGLDSTQSGIAEKTNELARLRDQLAKLKALDRGGILGDFDQKRIRSTEFQIRSLETELGGLWDRYKRLSEAQREAADSTTASTESAKQAGEERAKAAGDIEKEIASLDKLKKAYQSLSESLAKGKAEAQAGTGKPVEQSSVLDINALRERASKLLESGRQDDTKAALAMLEKAQKINDNLLATGQITKQYYMTQADLLLKLAQIGEDVAGTEVGVQVGIDAEASSEAAAQYLEISRTFWAQNPAYQPVIPVMQEGITSGNVAGTTDEGRVTISAAGFASGGSVRGPGTSLSDSILARLSAGEFVVKAQAVKNYGLGFLERLNSMALPRFAAGGPVGTPVNIYLPGGESFNMSASPSVAKAMSRVLGLEVLKRGRR